MNNVEQVLVVRRDVFDRVGSFQGISLEVDRFMDAFFSPGVLSFLPRPQAEEDPAYKQIIPYVLMTDGERYLSYVRGKRAGEKRLVGHRSIGIGGHINPVDDLPLLDSDPRETYLGAVTREVAEEVVLDHAPADHMVAVLNDDSTEVGSVHLGIVHYWRFPNLKVHKREQMITQLSLMTPAELLGVRDTLESWSQLCLDQIDVLASVGTPRRSETERGVAASDVSG